LEEKKMGSFDTPNYELPDYLKGTMKKKMLSVEFDGCKCCYCNKKQVNDDCTCKMKPICVDCLAREREKRMVKVMRLKYQDYYGDSWGEFVSKKDYLNVVEEKESLKLELYCHKQKIKELKKRIESKDNGNLVNSNEYDKLCKENKDLNEKLESLKSCEENPLAKFRPVEEWRKENKDLQFLCGERGKEIKRLEKEIEEFKKIIDDISDTNNEIFDDMFKDREKIKELENVIEELEKINDDISDTNNEIFDDMFRAREKIKELEREIEEMKNNIREIMCCQECEIYGLNKYKNQSEFTNKNIIIKNVLSEDCEVCKDKPVKVNNSSLYGRFGENFVDSWVLWYKVEGMDKAIQQFNLTKEECEIIYGNMNDITYWHMELMK
jgi:SMC interacting uncharacterized protein involved in chromosome segregation